MAYPRYLKSRDCKFATRTSGNFTTANVGAVFTVVDATLDLVLFAQVGDTIEAGVSCGLARPTADIPLDFGTLNGASIVTRFAGGASGIPGALGQVVGFNPVDAHYMLILTAADIASSTVTVRFLYATTAASQTIYANTSLPLRVWAKNLGPCDPH